MAYEARKSGVDCGNSIKQLAAYTHNHNTWNQSELPFVPYSDFSGITNDKSIASTVADTCVKMIKTVLVNGQNEVPYFGDVKLFDTFFHPQTEMNSTSHYVAMNILRNSSMRMWIPPIS